MNVVVLHKNPLQEKWKLVIDSLDHYFSSARYYENQIDDFGFWCITWISSKGG
jgi:hypothetical protein